MAVLANGRPEYPWLWRCESSRRCVGLLTRRRDPQHRPGLRRHAAGPQLRRLVFAAGHLRPPRRLLGDHQGVYDPATIDGRLLLGLKGQISEMELHTLA